MIFLQIKSAKKKSDVADDVAQQECTTIIATYVRIISCSHALCILDYLKLIYMSCASHMKYQIQHENFGSTKRYKSYNIRNRKKGKKHDGQERRNCKERRKTIEFYFVLLFGHIIEKSALKYEKTYAKK